MPTIWPLYMPTFWALYWLNPTLFECLLQVFTRRMVNCKFKCDTM